MPAVDWKIKPPSDKKVTWQWLPFKHSARKDDLQLSHWVKVVNGVPPSGDYSFAKYNMSVDITRYTDEEYEKYLANPEPYNVSQEIKRKRALSLILSQTKRQERRDEEVLAEAKRISGLRIKVAGESKSVAASNSSADVTERASPNETVSLSNMQRRSAVLPSTITRDNLGSTHVYLRTDALAYMMSKHLSVEYQTSLQQAFRRLGVNPTPRVPSITVCFEYLKLRNDIVTFTNLIGQIRRLQLQNEAANGSSFRDGSHGTLTHLHREEDLDWIPGKTDSGGARTGKRDQKSKASGQRKKASSTAQSKRKRK
ncbi:hypothetical protein KIW84_064366 [Lathyrus oleraceus]|uniref:SWR1-complex protein 4 n=1 Tax=Pisum sativum TaxID=3888 RepID=A0A9D4WA21_PEA|nr:hypothetical protein KIW84_064366 [Pisum sativum]